MTVIDRTEKEKVARAHAFYDVGHILKYEYDGEMTQDAIEKFFDARAEDIMLELNSEQDIDK